MLAQENRFHGHASLKYVYRNGNVSRSRLFVVKAITNSRRSNTRCSIVVSKKVLKSAVGRNRVRRRMYHLVHEYLPYIHDAQDIVVIIYSAEVATMPHTELRAQLLEQLSEAKVEVLLAQPE